MVNGRLRPRGKSPPLDSLTTCEIGRESGCGAWAAAGFLVGSDGYSSSLSMRFDTPGIVVEVDTLDDAIGVACAGAGLDGSVGKSDRNI